MENSTRFSRNEAEDELIRAGLGYRGANQGFGGGVRPGPFMSEMVALFGEPGMELQVMVKRPLQRLPFTDDGDLMRSVHAKVSAIFADAKNVEVLPMPSNV